MDMKQTIHCVISTLNDVEVKGQDNLDKLLGSILTLENVVRQIEKIASQKKEKEETNAD